MSIAQLEVQLQTNELESSMLTVVADIPQVALRITLEVNPCPHYAKNEPHEMLSIPIQRYSDATAERQAVFILLININITMNVMTDWL